MSNPSEGDVYFNLIITLVLFGTGFFYFLVSTLTFRPALSKVSIGLALVFGLLYEEINLFIYEMYSEHFMNPQVSTVAWMLLATTALSLTMLFRSRRTRERIMVLTTAWAIIIAWSSIHFAMIVNQLVYVTDTLSKDKAHYVQLYAKNNDAEGFLSFCEQAGYPCMISDLNLNPLKKSSKANPKAIFDGFMSIVPMHSSKVEENGNTYIVGHGRNLFYQYSAIAVNFHTTKENLTFLIYDNVDAAINHDTVRYHFYHWYALILIAWQSVCLLVIYRHRQILSSRGKL